ncbi:MAG: DNA-processing protein DprA [Timaviella obliquedivisa GSE-PSE-MK23-08B]|nr:DNA-processing protein DprA [Timaviella obliquedivisa GSE-PSE-MK23-08B]
MAQERAFWLAWSNIPGTGSILIQRLRQHFGTLAAAWVAPIAELEAVYGFGVQNTATIASARSAIDPENLLQQHEQANPGFWTPADDDYPQLLLEIPDFPPILYYQGTVDRLENQGSVPAIAIVGTRSPSDYGKRWTQKLTIQLTQAGFTIVSGLAAGIDTEAHYACLKAGGRTIAVLGTGVDVTYPYSNRSLAQSIIKHGLLVSEYAAGTQPDRTNFPRRNRIIAGLSRATLVIEAPQKSGALITARLANDYNRDVYALPGSLDNPASRGSLELLNQGAQVILGEAELLEALGNIPQLHSTTQLSLLALEPPAPPPDLPPELQTIFQVIPVISAEAIALDHIIEQTGQPTGAVLSALSHLELMGLIAQMPGMRYRREG